VFSKEVYERDGRAGYWAWFLKPLVHWKRSMQLRSFRVSSVSCLLFQFVKDLAYTATRRLLGCGLCIDAFFTESLEERKEDHAHIFMKILLIQ